jgi:high affinity choline transporter 7
LLLIVLGLGLAIPYVVAAAGGADAVWSAALGTASAPGAWHGFASLEEKISWSDWTILLILGGIPWNVYFQRVLASRNEKDAVTLSISAGFLCALMAVPPLILGLSARALDWTVLAATSAGEALGGPEAVVATLEENPAFVLPYLLRLAVPTWVAVLGLGAVAAAVMSSVDSSILSASSLVAWNGYHRLWLCGDVVYCVLFPQLALALFDRQANRVGALSGFVVSVFLRLGGGEATLGLPAFLPYPAWTDGEFPFRTLAMAAGLLTAWAVARVSGNIDPPRSLRNPSVS